MKRNRVSKSVWRLFGQHRSPEWHGVPFSEAGFTGPESARLIIDDEYQLEKLQKAVTPRERADAARGYLMKVTKNGYKAASERGDREAVDLLDEVWEDAAQQLVILAQRVKEHLRRFDFPEGQVDVP